MTATHVKKPSEPFTYGLADIDDATLTVHYGDRIADYIR